MALPKHQELKVPYTKKDTVRLKVGYRHQQAIDHLLGLIDYQSLGLSIQSSLCRLELNEPPTQWLEFMEAEAMYFCDPCPRKDVGKLCQLLLIDANWHRAGAVQRWWIVDQTTRGGYPKYPLEVILLKKEEPCN